MTGGRHGGTGGDPGGAVTGAGRDRALVVGASSAIGRAIAARLADDGFGLRLWGRDTGRLGECDRAPTQTADPAAWRRVLDVTLTAVAEATALLAPALVARAPSSLVDVGSGAAHRAHPDNAAYVASKHGLAALAEATWLDLRRDRVGVTLVSPGLVAAGAGLGAPLARRTPELLLQPGDVADAVGHAVGLATRSEARACATVIRLEPYVEP